MAPTGWWGCGGGSPRTFSLPLEEWLHPVIAKRGGNPQGQSHNINGDTVAGETPPPPFQGPKKLILLTVPGILRHRDDSMVRCCVSSSLVGRPVS